MNLLHDSPFVTPTLREEPHSIRTTDLVNGGWSTSRRQFIACLLTGCLKVVVRRFVIEVVGVKLNVCGDRTAISFKSAVS